MVVMSMLLTACGNNNADNNVSDSSNGGREVINQVSLLQGLTFGDYNGSVPVSRLKELGDIGIGIFDADETVKLANIDSVNTLKSELDKKVKELGENYFYMIRAEGTYSIMKVRSELNQTKPYKPLAEVLETDQTFFDYENIKGTVVGL